MAPSKKSTATSHSIHHTQSTSVATSVSSSSHSSATRHQHGVKTINPLSITRPVELVVELLTNHEHIWKLATLLFLGEIFLNVIIIKKVPYTEIDWIAYMQEVTGFLRGETDYVKLRGDTGPLVYPAGFVYIYSALYYLTDLGTNILKGQWFFMGLYMATLLVIFAIYAKDEDLPPYVLIFVCLSRRLHSIYVLRLFNDPVAMFFLYASILAFLNRRWTLSSTLFSLAVSVKMNILLFFPAFGYLVWQVQGVVGTTVQLVHMVLIQVALSLPFTIHHAESYLKKAFEFSRVFEYKWTVNWKMVDKKMFLSQEFAKALLVGHFVVLFAFVIFRWGSTDGGIFSVIHRGLTAPQSVLQIHAQYMKPSLVLTRLFTSNFIGIVFARTLHYQFYSWYYMTIPYLLWQTRIPLVLKVVLMGATEWSWNVFPATAESSSVLLACHGVMLLGLWVGLKKSSNQRKSE